MRGEAGARYGTGGALAQKGRVVEFDDGTGLGELLGVDGQVVPFHCTEVSDGARTVATGTEVTYRLRPGHLGAWEAVEVTPLSAETATA